MAMELQARCVLVAVACVAGMAMPALAQVTAPAGPAAPQTRSVRPAHPQRDTLQKMMRRITVDFEEKRLEDVINFVRDFTGADLEPLWMDDRNGDGLDKDRLVTIRVENITSLRLMERLLEQARGDFGGDNSWQMSDTGAMQIGPKSRLNRTRRVEIYDINDLITEIPDYREVPRIDLQQALQASQQGGGGGQGPFREEGQTQEERRQNREERSREIMELIQNLAEPEQWIENGGEGGSMRYWQGALIVNAPDYMHRAINGYPYWPAEGTQRQVVNGRRYVTLDGDTGVSRLNGVGQQPVSAVVGGQIIRSDQPGGGGR
jgi:hypothetical protein